MMRGPLIKLFIVSLFLVSCGDAVVEPATQRDCLEEIVRKFQFEKGLYFDSTELIDELQAKTGITYCTNY
jgi:hypothetical protein